MRAEGLRSGRRERDQRNDERRDADKRVLRRVVDLSDLYGAVIPLTQDDVAELAGATRPTVNRVLKDAESASAVRLSRCRIEVVDRGLLCRLAG